MTVANASKSKTKKTDKSKSKSDRSEKLEASLYFLEWTRTALQSYTRTVNELYLKKMLAHCTKTKVESERSIRNDADEAEKLARGLQTEAKLEYNSIKERLKLAAVRKSIWEEDPEPLKLKMISFAETAAMWRLQQLVQMSGALLEQMEKASKWSDANAKILRDSVKVDVFEFVNSMFEATCAIAEVFSLTSLDRGKCKPEMKRRLRATSKEDYAARENRELEIGSPKQFVPPLEARINHYRTIVHIIGTSLVSLIQTYLNSIPQEQVELRVREVKEILDRLPPMYLRTDEMSLCRYTAKLLGDPPPNTRTYPLAPKGDISVRSRSGKSIRSGKTARKSKSKSSQRSGRKKNANVTSSKYKNPISNRSKSKRSSTKESKNRSNRSANGKKSEMKSKSKSGSGKKKQPVETPPGSKKDTREQSSPKASTPPSGKKT